MTAPPLVSVVVPARDEAPHIAACLAAVAAQDYPHDRIEVVVVDGASADGTAEAARRALDGSRFRRAVVLANPAATTPANLNLGLSAAEGEIVCRVDARSRIPPHYVRGCVEVLSTRPDVVVTGGAQVAVPPGTGAAGRGIARALNNRWAMGLSRYRRGAPTGPADTVYLGAFRTRELRAAGGWDERLGTNQDFDLNRRMAGGGGSGGGSGGGGGIVWFDRDLAVDYVPRPTIGRLFTQYHRFGRAKARYWRLTGDRPQPRQLALIVVPAVAAVALVAGLANPRLRRTALAGAVAVPVLVECGGNRQPAPPVDHGFATAALAAVAGGWWTGVCRELVGRRG